VDNAIAFMTATEMVARFRAGELSPVTVVEEALERIARFEPTLNAFQLVDAESARAAARAAEARWAEGAPQGPLDGVPVTIKDLVATKGWPTLQGSLTVDPAGPWTEDAPVVARLREAGAVLLGKTTTTEFGWKGITDSPLAGVTRNPWNPKHSPGGSSGGAAAALAAGIGGLAHGNDGGGSIRIPASYSGLFGIKPTFGRVPHAPNTGAYATLASNGPLTRSVADAALMLTVIAQPDARDWYAAAHDGRDYRVGLDEGMRGTRLGLGLDLGGATPDDEIAAIVEDAVTAFAERGATVERVGPLIDPLRPRFEDYWLAGFAYRLGDMSPDRRDRVDPGLRALAERGAAVGLDAYYRAVEARAELGVTMNRFHERFDLLITPTMPTAAPRADVVYHSPEFDRWTHAVPYTVPFNLTGQPAASIPCGLTRAGLPVGLQIIGPRFHDAAVLRAARAFERTLAWPNPHPGLLASLAAIG